ncbi:hypothetical protein MACJ_003149 [Theileria orientalis]|uniref:Uncharacterized protein n=1 Tax=Theileria orientalis TaxID=68886 RepID=A0A976QRY0_THEOR|nr:hypothetical protein MACJ_003149 [Theileria orientalis]
MRECGSKNTVEKNESSIIKANKNKMETKSKDSKKSKITSSEKKGSIVQDLKNSGVISKDLWNYSTKITKVDTNKTEEPTITKQKYKNITSKLNLPTKSCTSIKKESVTKKKVEPQEKKISTKEKSKNKEQIKESPIKNDKKIKEPIYISYSLNGFIKLKSTRDIVICDKYYQESIETTDDFCCECQCCRNEEIQDENQCGCFPSNMKGVEGYGNRSICT